MPDLTMQECDRRFGFTPEFMDTMVRSMRKSLLHTYRVYSHSNTCIVVQALDEEHAISLAFRHAPLKNWERAVLA
jgi:hypothetical protein